MYTLNQFSTSWQFCKENYKKCQCKQNFLRLFVKHRGNIYFDGCVQYQREWRLWIGLFGVAYDDIVQRLKINLYCNSKKKYVFKAVNDKIF